MGIRGTRLASLGPICVFPLLLSGMAQAQVPGETIAVIGTGNVGGALGKRWADAGHTIVYGSRTPDDARVRALVAATGHGATATTQAEAAAKAEIVLVALPWSAAETVVATLGDLRGKILVDPMNATTVRDGYVVPSDMPMSVAEQVQSWAPDATVVKAFSTLNFRIMEDPSLAGGPVTVPLSGDDGSAKERVARLVRDVGLEPLDVGPLVSARYVEDMLRLYSGFRLLNPGQAFEYHLRLRPN